MARATTRDLRPDERRRTMLYWLGVTLKQEREAKNLKLADLLTILRAQGEKTAESTLSRLENGLTWSRETEKIVATYAYMCGIEDARDIWAKAVRQWLTHGGVPVLGEPTAPMRAYLLGLEAERRSRPEPDESQAAPTSTAHHRRVQ